MGPREKLLREIFGETSVEETPPRPINTQPLFPLREIWPEVVERLKALLTEAGEFQLAATVDGLWVYDRCDCGADHCAMVDTQPRTSSGYGPNHRTVVFWPRDMVNLDTGKTIRETREGPFTEFMTILDVVNEEIACIEIMDDHESRRLLDAALPCSNDAPDSSEGRKPIDG